MEPMDTDSPPSGSSPASVDVPSPAPRHPPMSPVNQSDTASILTSPNLQIDVSAMLYRTLVDSLIINSTNSGEKYHVLTTGSTSRMN